MGAVMNVQLDRIDGIIAAMRRERDQILAGIAPALELGLKLAPLNSKDDDCGANVFLTLPDAEAAESFVKTFPSVIAGKTGRHTYIEWDQVLQGAGAAHPLMNPYNMPANARCRRTYSRDMCARSLDILNRTVLVPTHPLHTREETANIIHNVIAAARVALGLARKDQVELKSAAPVDTIKYDTKQLAW